MMQKATQTTRFKILIAAASIAVLAPVLLFGGPHRGGGFGPEGMHGGHGLHGLRQLDLSEDQRQQLHEVMMAKREEGGDQRQQLHDARRALAEKVHAESFDEAGIRQAAQQVAALEENQAVARAQVFQEVRKILTPEQLEELKNQKQEHRERRHDRRGHHGHGADEAPVGE